MLAVKDKVKYNFINISNTINEDRKLRNYYIWSRIKIKESFCGYGVAEYNFIYKVLFL